MQKVLITFVLILLISCGKEKVEDAIDYQSQARVFLDNYNLIFQELLYASAEAEWKANTYIIDGDEETEKLVQEANEAFSAFTGSKDNIDSSKYYLDVKDKLTSLQVKQFETILYMAGRNPMSAEEKVKELIAANNTQMKNMFGYTFKIKNKEVTPNEIDKILIEEDDLKKRLEAWEASKMVGVSLKEGLENLQTLRNEVVQSLGYKDFFQYEVSDYGYTTEELVKVCKDMINDIWPLYRELHTWARYELASKYKEDVPEYLPAHWLSNKWGQDWADLIEVEGINLDKELNKKSADWIVKKGEEFYVSMGFPPLPQSFYDKSSLYPLPPNSNFKKNTHASAWHMNNAEDVRSLMSVEPNTRWWSTTLHELGHIYYYISYSNNDVPIILRGGANRAFHEGIGTMIGLASLQLPFLQELNLVPADAKVDEVKLLLREALDYVVVIPWGAGVMTMFEHELYSKSLPKDQYNKKWWELKKKYQGIVPPSERSEDYCDACTKTHINNDPAQYYDYAISTVLLFQLHNHIATNILNQDPHSTNYWGNKEVGQFLKDLTYPGATVDWRVHLQEMIGEDFSAKAIVAYFEPLMEWLKKENQGRTYTLPEKL
jgi:peptidyl-dipeptidase A